MASTQTDNPSEKSTLSVMVIADNAYARDGLADVVSQEGFTVSALLADDARQDAPDADCAIFLGAPEGQDTDLPTLALVTDVAQAHHALRQGARGVVHATTAPLSPALTAVAAGHYVIAPEYIPEAWLAEPTPATHSALRLTPREQEVLPLLADGCSNKAIAEALGVSVHTARFHVQSLLDKFGAESRTEAVTLAFRVGLLDL